MPSILESLRQKYLSTEESLRQQYLFTDQSKIQNLYDLRDEVQIQANALRDLNNPQKNQQNNACAALAFAIEESRKEMNPYIEILAVRNGKDSSTLDMFFNPRMRASSATEACKNIKDLRDTYYAYKRFNFYLQHIVRGADSLAAGMLLMSLITGALPPAGLVIMCVFIVTAAIAITASFFISHRLSEIRKVLGVEQDISEAEALLVNKTYSDTLTISDAPDKITDSTDSDVVEASLVSTVSMFHGTTATDSADAADCTNVRLIT